MSPPFPPGPSIPMPPVKPPARRFGIRMSGCERPLEDLIKQHASLVPAHEIYTLVEVGSAGCVSLRSFRDILAEARGIAPWRVIGFDLPEDKAWSLDWAEINKAFDGKPNVLRDVTGVVEPGQMALWLLDDPRGFWRHNNPYVVHFLFIDGSHGISCGRDFEAWERTIAPGGLVVFHDYGEAEQGSDWQHADREFISVRSYVHRLGLASPCVVPRKGWRFVGEIKGSRHWGGDGNSAAVVQRTEEALERQPELDL